MCAVYIYKVARFKFSPLLRYFASVKITNTVAEARGEGQDGGKKPRITPNNTKRTHDITQSTSLCYIYQPCIPDNYVYIFN